MMGKVRQKRRCNRVQPPLYYPPKHTTIVIPSSFQRRTRSAFARYVRVHEICIANIEPKTSISKAKEWPQLNLSFADLNASSFSDEPFPAFSRLFDVHLEKQYTQCF